MSVEYKHFTPCSAVKENEKIIDCDLKKVLNLGNQQWIEFLNQLKETLKREQENNRIRTKIIVSENVLICLDKWFSTTVANLQNSDEEVVKPLLDILRVIRNCTSNLKTQQYILDNTKILNTSRTLFCKLLEIDKNNICLKVLLQFLANLISSNEQAREHICPLFYDGIKSCLKNTIHIYECSALIYNISLSLPINDIEIITIIFDVQNIDNHNEFLTFFLVNSISSVDFWNIYEQLDIRHRIIALETLKELQLSPESHNLPITAVGVLINVFLKSTDVVFQMTQEKDDNKKAYEVSLILEIMSSLSSDENYLNTLQCNKNVLINAGVLLINVHRLGKDSENCFTPIQKLSEIRENSELKHHPAFGFKADLIRLIGNLCWKNAELQNLARTAELIPVILDSCNMDARNPFIIQWAIFAVRNLCENNQENQKLIAGLHQQGTVSSETLTEMGLTLHTDGENRLNIVPLNALKNLSLNKIS